MKPLGFSVDLMQIWTLSFLAVWIQTSNHIFLNPVFSIINQGKVPSCGWPQIICLFLPYYETRGRYLKLHGADPVLNRMSETCICWLTTPKLQWICRYLLPSNDQRVNVQFVIVCGLLLEAGRWGNFVKHTLGNPSVREYSICIIESIWNKLKTK